MLAIKGLQKTTLLDYPAKVACIVFLGNCNFRCPFCQNRELVLDNKNLPTIPKEDFFKFLKDRVGKLDGVVVTGGEPTIQPALPEFIKAIKKLDFLVKLDTNGTNPEMVEKLLKDGLVDYLALDFKGPLGQYYKYIGQLPIANCQIPIKTTIEILVKSGLDFELRTTVVPTLHTKEDLIKMAEEIKSLSIRYGTRNTKWYLQQFSPHKCLDKNFEKIKPYPKSFFEEIIPKLKKFVPSTKTRGI